MKSTELYSILNEYRSHEVIWWDIPAYACEK
jgi:hypothetical protein